MTVLTAKVLKSDSNFIDDFRFAMYWMPSSQAVQFDEWLRIPIVDHERFESSAMDYILSIEKLAPGSELAAANVLFERFLNQLATDGEDVDRLMLWFASVYIGQDSLGLNPRSCKLWIETLTDWARRDTLELHFDNSGVDNAIAKSYINDVWLPERTLFQNKVEAKQQWANISKNGTKFDNVVNEVYFKNVRGYPASFFRCEIGCRLHREWWRSVFPNLTELQMDRLSFELQDSLSKSTTPELIDWESVARIDHAFTIELVPGFHSVARDW